MHRSLLASVASLWLVGCHSPDASLAALCLGCRSNDPAEATAGNGTAVATPNVVLDGGVAMNGGKDIFALSISADRKSLIDQHGRRFLLVGDSAWSLVTQLTKAETVAYLDDRRNRGFNAILVDLMEHKFTDRRPPWKNAEGVVPFADNRDFTRRNPAFFDHAAWVVERAAERGMLVLMAPAYMGYNCGDEGWCSEMRANGVEKLTRFGRFVGERFRDLPNIVWVEGGDLVPSTSGAPSQLDLVNAVANGIREGDRGSHLHTAHWARGVSSSEGPRVPWLDLDSTYSGLTFETHRDSLADFARSVGKRPVLFLEGRYESEKSTNDVQLRAQMYQPVLSGSTGFVFGNNPIWSFANPKDGNPSWAFLSGGAVPWRTATGSAGAASASRAKELFSSLPWHALLPDVKRKILKSSPHASDPAQNVVLASSPDGRLVVAYFTAALSATLDLNGLSRPLAASWYDPVSGARTPAAKEPLASGGLQTFSPPGNNAGSAPDWVLLLETR